MEPPSPPRPKPKVVAGPDLWRDLLDFPSERAFQRWRQKGDGGGIKFYPVPGQSRGVFARRDELDAWLAVNEPPGRANKQRPGRGRR
jgi:hypothetical protein